jgi:hypothetical protein
MTIHIPKEYLIYGGLAIAAGLAYWYLKSNGYWDTWFSASGNVIPVGPIAQPQVATIPGTDAPIATGYVN